MRFTGFPPDALDFFVELEGNNERPWWLANKERFDASVAEPMRALLDRLEPEFGEFKVFRMNRDVRFSADKSPYKTAHAAVSYGDGAAATYLQISANGLYAGGGMYHLASDQLERFRTAVADETHGAELEAALAAARGAALARHRRCRAAAGHRPSWVAEGPPAHRPAADEGADHRA